MDILKTGKDLRRLNEIINILIKYGFGDMIRRMGLAESMEKAGKLLRYQMPDEFLSLRPPERARRAMEEMGPTFIKLGQILATRVDLFSPEWIEEFEKLQDENTALPLDSLIPQIDNSLGKPNKDVFRYIDPSPLGTASMAQVHRATLFSGEQVVLKIRKPGIREKIESDMRLVNHLARVAQSQSVELRRYKPVDIVKEFEKSLLRELDFSIESKNAERIAESLKKISYVKIPKVYWDWTCEDLNVQEYFKGIPAKNIKELMSNGLDPQLIAHRGAKIAWQTMLIDGFFHADPHPGNFLVLPKNQIAMLDFGMVGKLSNARREQLMKLTRHIVLQDAQGAAAVLMEWADSSVNFDALAGEAEDFIQQYYGLSLSELNIPKMITDCTGILRNYDIQLPPDIALFSKACITLEGFGRLLNPQFDLMTEAEPLIKQWGKTRYSPASLAKKLGVRALNVVDKLYEEPRPEIHTRSVQAIQAQTWDKQQVERWAKRFEHQKFRQTQVAVACCYLIISALLLLVPAGPQLYGYSIIGIIGLMLSTFSIQWYLFLMWWAKRSQD
ncbi:MAG: AarF/UbiB family protein [Pseudomonadales bacterium]|nr:AarF/UbiB family protein [Pseudomonadales bacterium]